MKKNLLLFALLFLITGAMLGQQAPTVILRAPAVTDITLTTAVGHANVTDSAGFAITERGFYWSTTQPVNTTTNPNHVSIDGGSTGPFECELTGLTPGTHYYAMAYARNSEGIVGYSGTADFWTLCNVNTGVSPADFGTVTGGGAYALGTEVTLRATAYSGYQFVNWTENNQVVQNAGESYTFTVTGNRNLVANFAQLHTITVLANPTTGGSVTGGGTYTNNTNCTLTATANTGYNFVNWTKNGSVINTNACFSFTVTESATYVANFAPQQYNIVVSPNNNDWGTVAGGGIYDYGTNCHLIATANDHYHFLNWTEDGQVVTNAGFDYTFQVTGNRTLVANFGPNSYTITTNVTPTGAGTVSGGGTHNYGTTVTLTATANQGYHFSQWSDGVTQNPRQITVSGAATYTAQFAPNPYDITASVYPTNAGTVTGAGTYNYLQNCTLTATANYGYNFVNWTKNGMQVSSEPTYSFTVTDSAEYVAHFTALNYMITATADPEVGGTVSGSGGYDYNTSCILTATANTGYTFINWTKNGTEVSTQASFTFTVTETAQYIAHFQINYYDITTNVTPANSGTVTGGGNYAYGTQDTLTAYNNYGFHFGQWSDGITTASRIITVTGNATYTAEFIPNVYPINTNVTPPGAGTVEGDGEHNYGEPITLTATPNYGYHFDSWKENGTVQSNNANYSFQVEGPRTLEAHFEPNQYTITASVTPTGSGTVTGANTYNYLQNITLTATPATGYHFLNWTEEGQEIQGAGANYTFQVEGNRTLVANFEINSYTVTAIASGSGAVSGGGTYTHGQIATLTATANEHNHFVRWEDYSTQNPRQITVTGPGTYTAYFAIDQHTITVNANPSDGGSVDGGGVYNYGSHPTLTATPAPGYHFTQWQDGNQQPSRQITVTGDATYTASFAPENYVITVNAEPTNGGTVTGGGGYSYGNTTNLSAIPNSGYTFQSWQDGVTDNPRSITVTGSATYTAYFAQAGGPTTYMVTANANPNEAGTITGMGTYQPGATATLTATANEHYHFNHWQDGNTEPQRTFTVNSNMHFTAYFTLDQYTITANADPTNGGSVSGGGTYNYGAIATLTATANSGYSFQNWDGGNTQNPRQITVTNNATYTANFEELPAPEYTITVNADPANGGTVTGSGTYPEGTVVTLTATANQGYNFTRWNDGATQPQRQITVMGNATYTAFFERQQYTVTTVAVPENGGEVTGSGTYPEGTVVTLTATPNQGYSFSHWQNGSTENPLTITVTENVTYTATFTPVWYTITVLADPEDGGEVTGGGQYMYGQSCTINAIENEHFFFINWTDEEGYQQFADHENTFIVTGNRTLVAHFAGEGQHIVYVDIDPSDGGTTMGAGVYNDGEECTLKAFAKLGYHFVSWTRTGEEQVLCGVPTFTFTVTETGRYTAHFERNTYTITATASPENGGSVEGYGIYYYGVSCTLTAYPNDYYEFLYWKNSDNAVVSEQPEYTFTVTADASFTAYFSSNDSYTISVEADPTDGGTVYVGDTQGTTEMQYSYSQPCTVTALPNEDYTFVNWTVNDTVVSNETVYTFTVRKARTLVAHFTQQFVITVSSNNSEWGTVDGGGTFNDGDVCRLIATPEDGYSFANWTENGEEIPNEGPTYVFAVHGNRNLVANFREKSCVGDLQRIQPKYHHTTANDSVILVLIYPNPQYDYNYQWYRDDVEIPDATGQYYYQKGGVDDGVYTVKISRKDIACSDFSEPYHVSQSRYLCIYPNPSRRGNGVVVKKDCDGQAQLTVYSADGRVLYTEMVTDSQVTLNLNLPSGVYVARLIDSEGYTKIGKLIIK